MGFQPGAMLNVQSFGLRPENIEVPHYNVRIPASSDWNYPVGKEWIYTGNSIWKLLSISSSQGVNTANWVQIASSTGAILSVSGTANEITATTSSGDVTLSIPTTFTSPGSVTATLGDITATNGNLVLSTAGNKLEIATGADASIGTATLATGTIVVATTAVTASSIILISRNTPVGTVGDLSVPTASIIAGTSFVINSDNAGDTSTVNWLIIN